MGQDKYVAYVGTYTHGSSVGVHVYDLDVENGYMTERDVVPVNNASHLTKSTNGKYLYSIADEGVEVLKIDPKTGDLTAINKVGIDGMRGCFLSTDQQGRFLFVAGYHDGKVTVVHTHRDGRLGSVMDGIFHKSIFSVAERNFRPHISCVMPTPDGKFLCVVERHRSHQHLPGKPDQRQAETAGCGALRAGVRAQADPLWERRTVRLCELRIEQ